MKNVHSKEEIRAEVYRLLDSGMPGKEIRARMGLSIMQLAGYRAGKTKMENQYDFESENQDSNQPGLYIPSSVLQSEENSQLVKILEKASKKLTPEQTRQIVIDLKDRGLSNDEIHSQPILRSVGKWTIAGHLAHYTNGTYKARK